jgi:hypothetical protein
MRLRDRPRRGSHLRSNALALGPERRSSPCLATAVPSEAFGDARHLVSRQHVRRTEHQNFDVLLGEHLDLCGERQGRGTVGAKTAICP